MVKCFIILCNIWQQKMLRHEVLVQLVAKLIKSLVHSTLEILASLEWIGSLTWNRWPRTVFSSSGSILRPPPLTGDPSFMKQSEGREIWNLIPPDNMDFKINLSLWTSNTSFHFSKELSLMVRCLLFSLVTTEPLSITCHILIFHHGENRTETR